MADIVKDTYDRSKGQETVIFQQKKPLLNYELNLAQEIINRKIKEADTLNILTNYNGDSFKIYPSLSQHKVMVKDGVFYHKGQPLHLTIDKEVDMTSFQDTGTYIIYAEWYIGEVDGSIDGNIGFVTSREKRVIFDILVSDVDLLPEPTEEAVSFMEANSSITLQTGYFPNWMRTEGTRFTSNSLNNPGKFENKTYFEVLSSPDEKTIIVNGSSNVEDEFNLSNVEFYQYANASKVIPNKFKAYRRNILPLADVTRTLGTPLVATSDITDIREKSVYNFLSKGTGEVTNPGGVILDISAGEFWVGDESYFIEEGTRVDMSYTTSSMNYVCVSGDGKVWSVEEEPVDFHVMLAEVQVNVSSGIANIIDKRIYRPFAWDDKYGQGSGTGETGKEALTVQYTADDDLLKGDAVGFTGPRSVGKASISSDSVLPVIGLAASSFNAGQKDNIVVHGEVSNSLWSWNIGESVFLDGIGGLTQTPTLTAGQYVQRVGVATETTTVFVKTDLAYIRQEDVYDDEARLLSLRDDGTLQIIHKNNKLYTDRLSFLASIEIPNTTSFKVLPGRYFLSENQSVDLKSETIVDLSTTVTTNYSVSGQVNKIFYTISEDDAHTTVISHYEGIPADDIDDVEDPFIPENEMPLCVVDFEYTSQGTPPFIDQNNITDKRVWLNLGSLDNTSFRPIYRSENKIIVQKGEAWFNNVYVKLPENLDVTANVTVDGATYYIYLDTDALVGTEWFKTTPTLNPEASIVTTTDGFSLVDRRRFIPLGTYTVQNITGFNEIRRESFIRFKAKFLQYRDAPYTDLFTENVSIAKNIFNVNSVFSFINEDYLEIEINGVRYYKNDDYQIYEPSTVTFLFDVQVGSKVTIKKV